MNGLSQLQKLRRVVRHADVRALVATATSESTEDLVAPSPHLLATASIGPKCRLRPTRRSTAPRLVAQTAPPSRRNSIFA